MYFKSSFSNNKWC